MHQRSARIRSPRRQQFYDALKAVIGVGFLTILSGSITYDALLFPQNTYAVAVWSLLYIFPMAVRRTHADAGAVCLIVISGLQLIFGPSLIVTNVTAIVMLYSAIVYGNPRNSRRYLLTALVMGVAVALINTVSAHRPPFFSGEASSSASFDSSFFLDAPIMALTLETFLLSAAAFGYWRRARLAQLNLLRERNRVLEESQKEEAHIATLAERSRIARDMHDVVAHTLSIIIVQADGGRYAGAQDPDVALSTMHTIREEAGHALSGMHGLLGTLDDAQIPRRKPPELVVDYASIDALIHEAQAASGSNLVIERTVRGKPPLATLRKDLGRVLFRTVQEALSNVRKYAGNGVHVDIVEVWGKEEVTLSITDDGKGAAASKDGHHPGYGLIGMRERVTSLGGTLSVSPTDHGFSIRATLPLAESTNGSDTLEGREKTNVIERISLWTQTHFVLVDIVGCTLLALFLVLSEYLAANDGNMAWEIVLCIAFCAALSIRRAFPQLSAALVAGFLIISLLTLPGLQSDGPIIALFSLYSVIAYGPRSATKWVYPTCVCVTGLATINEWNYIRAKNETWLAMSETERENSNIVYFSDTQTLFSCTFIAILIAITCIGIIFFALWRRSRGSNVVLLRSREEALLHQQEQQAALAANLERARISEQIQKEVTDTLGRVLQSADSRIAVLTDIKNRHDAVKGAEQKGDSAASLQLPEEDSSTIQEAFASIASIGRTALAQMRELLGILRQNETQEEANRPQLSPIMETTPQTRLTEDGKHTQQ